MPTYLSERIRNPLRRDPDPAGEFVLYWMRTAVRGHDNPALHLTLTLARELRRPVFVYHGLSEKYPWASDRHHTFIMEGARDVRRELAGRGIGYAFHLERPGHRGPVLKELGSRAAAVVTEDMPVRPLRDWTARLAGSIAAPVYVVDTACIVPMTRAGRAFDRAFAYRNATRSDRAERVERYWIESDPPSDGPFRPDLPFEPVDLESAAIPDLVAGCEIDHSVPPVPHTPGGSVAGYARWEAFREERLAHYARDRNDPLRDGSSRMSAYLHYGQVSPFRLTREAAAASTEGSRKYLDELMIWRELAYTFCLYTPEHDSIAALPEWARETLEKHREDPRPADPGLDAMHEARTGDALWDAAQTWLRVHGELHNNVRMTWGKALLEWSPDAATALARLIELNNRWALDGRDPNSYGGILWCLGQFDRPFPPARPVLGTVRPRPTSAHARRLDVDRFRRRAGRATAGAQKTSAPDGLSPAGPLFNSEGAG